MTGIPFTQRHCAQDVVARHRRAYMWGARCRIQEKRKTGLSGLFSSL